MENYQTGIHTSVIYTNKVLILEAVLQLKTSKALKTCLKITVQFLAKQTFRENTFVSLSWLNTCIFHFV